MTFLISLFLKLVLEFLIEFLKVDVYDPKNILGSQPKYSVVQ
jgi:hypothetical protein